MGFFNKNTPEAMVSNQIQQQLTFVNNKYVEIGRYVKLNLADKIDDENVKTMLSQIDNSLNELKNLNDQLNAIRGLKNCVSCSTLIPANVTFCPNCGAKQPVVVAPAPAAPAQPVQAAAMANSTPMAAQQTVGQFQQPAWQSNPAPQPAWQGQPVQQPNWQQQPVQQPNWQQQPVQQPNWQQQPVQQPVPQPVITNEVPVQPSPVTNDIPVAVEQPAVNDVPVAVEQTVVNDVPVAVEQPVANDVPVAVEQPAVNDVPVEVEQPVVNEIPVEVEQPAEEAVSPVISESTSGKYIFCSMCGHKEPASAGFCSQCGGKL